MATIGTDLKDVSALKAGSEVTHPPTWVWMLTGADAHSTQSAGEIREIGGTGCAVLSAVIRDVPSLGALDFQQAVCRLYTTMGERLRASAYPHAVRMWNFIPRIHERMGSRDGGILDRYMVFNAGRFAAYTRWYGGSDIGPQAATATGIGHSGTDLEVHCLALPEPGTAVENPRQVPAYRYSKRRGPLPPCFARATIATLNGERVLMVGGTASVRGESSIHPGDVRAQTLETFRNMSALVLGKADPAPAQERAALGMFKSLRVYCVFGDDIPKVRELVEARFGGLESVEYVRADVCRRTLLVEIEGTALV